jgi:hypothetical protein
VELLFYLGIVVAVVVGERTYTHLYGPRARARRRLHDGAPVGGEHDAVTLTGTVRLVGPPLRAPLSGRPCALYLASVSLRDGRDRLSSLLADDEFVHPLVIHESKMRAFVLSTAQGEFLILGDEPTLAFELPAPRAPPADLTLAFLERWNVPAEQRQHAHEFRELVVEAGEQISVNGVLTQEAQLDASPAGYRASARQACLRGRPDRPLTIGPARE